MRPGLPITRSRHAPAVNGVCVAAQNLAFVDDKEAGSECDAGDDAGNGAFAELLVCGCNHCAPISTSTPKKPNSTAVTVPPALICDHQSRSVEAAGRFVLIVPAATLPLETSMTE